VKVHPLKRKRHVHSERRRSDGFNNNGSDEDRISSMMIMNENEANKQVKMPLAAQILNDSSKDI